MLDTGKAPGATVVDLAGVNCGPPRTPLRTGTDVECGLTASVGSAIMIVKIEAPNARRFAIVDIAAALGPLSGAAGAAQAACHVGRAISVLQSPRRPTTRPKRSGGAPSPARVCQESCRVSGVLPSDPPRSCSPVPTSTRSSTS